MVIESALDETACLAHSPALKPHFSVLPSYQRTPSFIQPGKVRATDERWQRCRQKVCSQPVCVCRARVGFSFQKEEEQQQKIGFIAVC